MRVCLISREIAPFMGGRVAASTAAWARALVAAGGEVWVVTRDHPGLAESAHAMFSGVVFHTIDPADGPPKLDHDYNFARHSLAVLKTVRRLHGSARFDVIEYPEVFAEGHAVSQAKRAGLAFGDATLVCRLHGSSALSREQSGDRTYPHYAAYLDIMEAESVAHADLVVADSSSAIEEMGGRLERERVGMMRRSAVLPAVFEPLPEAEANQAEDADARPLVLCPGRLDRRKGQDVLLDAARVLTERGVDARYVFAGADSGSGPFGRSMRKTLESRLGALADRVEITGPVPRDDLAALVRSAAAVVFPARWTGVPHSMLEAMEAGKAVVSTGAGGAGELIEHDQSGLLCEAGDARCLADALERVLGDAAAAGRLGASARGVRDRLGDPVESYERLVGDADLGRERPADEKPLVSVVVPHFNLSRYLPATIASVRAQTHERIEIIVVDDGSTDADVPAVLDRLEGGGVRVLRQANAGLAGARNAGIAAAAGEYVLPVDADDLLDRRFVELAVGVLQREPGAAYCTSLVGYFRDEAVGSDGMPRRHYGGWLPLGLHRDLLTVHNCGGCCMAVFRKQALLDAGGYCDELTAYEDWDLYCALAQRCPGESAGKGWASAVIPEFLLHYRIRPGSMLRSEGEMRKQHLYATVLARHPGLAVNHSRVQRIMLSERMQAANVGSHGLRYRLVDRLNSALKGSVLHKAMKRVAARAVDRG